MTKEINAISLRLMEIIKEKNIPFRRLGVLLHLDHPNSFEKKLMTKNAKLEFINEIIAHIPGVNPTWVLTGKGDKYLTDQNDYRIKVANGQLATSLGYGDGDISHFPTVRDLISHYQRGIEPSARYRIPGLMGDCVSFYYSGFNMYPTIMDEDLLVCVRVTLEDIIDDYIYVVKARYDQSVTVCRVYQYKADEVIELHPDSRDSSHNIIRVQRKDVEFILKVRGRFTRKLAKYTWYLT